MAIIGHTLYVGLATMYDEPMVPYIAKTTVSEILKNIDFYTEKYLHHGLLAFRGLNCTEQEQLKILDAIGVRTGTTFKDGQGRYFRYQEDHSLAIGSRDKENSRDNILVGWHLENPSYPFPQRAAGWRMFRFSTHPANGTTGFVDMSEVVNNLPQYLFDFAQRSKYAFYGRTMWRDPDAVASFKDSVNKMKAPVPIFDSDVSKHLGSYPHKAIDPHPNTGAHVLRLSPWGGMLFSVDDRRPTEDEQRLGQELYDWAFTQIVDRKENQYWWSWQQGDLLVPDLFKMAHAVKGGFQPGDREFVGFWGFDNAVLNEPFDGDINSM